MAQHNYSKAINAAIDKLLALIDNSEQCGAYGKKMYLQFNNTLEADSILSEAYDDDKDNGAVIDAEQSPCDEQDVDTATNEYDAFVQFKPVCPETLDQITDEQEEFMLNIPGDPNADPTEQAMGYVIDQLTSFEFPQVQGSTGPGEGLKREFPNNIADFFNAWDRFEVWTKRYDEDNFYRRGSVYRGAELDMLNGLEALGSAQENIGEYQGYVLPHYWKLSAPLALLRPGDTVRFRLLYRQPKNNAVNPFSIGDMVTDLLEAEAKTTIAIAINLVEISPIEQIVETQSAEPQGWFMNA